MSDVPSPRTDYPWMSFTFEDVRWLLAQTRPMHVAERWEHAVNELLERRAAAVPAPESSRREAQLEAQVEAQTRRALKAERRVVELEAKLAKK